MTTATPQPSALQQSDEVSVPTKRWHSIIMIIMAIFCCMLPVSYASQQYSAHSLMYSLIVLSSIAAIACPFILLWRAKIPEVVFWVCCGLVLVLPFSSVLVMMALTAYLARRSNTIHNIIAIISAAVVAVIAELRDAFHPVGASFWHVFYYKQGTGVNGVEPEMQASEITVIATAVIAALAGVVIATLIGLHIRSKAIANTAQEQAEAAHTQTASLQQDLTNQKLADAIAAEAHDTLAHSLSLLAVNASALQAETAKLGDSEQAQSIANKAGEIRKQAAGTLDEAHSIIDMLRHPQTAWEQLAPSSETALTRESLDSLLGDARSAGMQLNTWIDIQQLSELDSNTAKVAYRAIQEGLTNARRHAPQTPVSLELSASPTAGVRVHLTNPTTAASVASATNQTAAANDASAATSSTSGNGLPGLTARAQALGGTCYYGYDKNNQFHIDVQLPWVAAQSSVQ